MSYDLWEACQDNEREKYDAMLDKKLEAKKRLLAEKRRVRLRTIRLSRKKGAAAGGMASAANKDKDIIDTLQRYKGRHPGDTMTRVCKRIVDDGALKYENEVKLLARLSRMGKRMTPPKNPSEIYAALK